MNRLYLLVPDANAARRLTDELRQAGLDEHHIHLVAKDHHLLEREHLPEAGLWQRSEFVPAFEKGLAAGGVTGLLAGIAAVTFPPAGLILGGGAVLGTTLFGAGLGAWLAGTLGISQGDDRIRQLEQSVEQGQLLMLIDVPEDRSATFERIVEQYRSV